MINYIREDNNSRFKYIFNGDFEQFLLDVGVLPDHIDKMKKKLLKSQEDYWYVYEETNEHKEMLVPLERVIGTSRGTVGASVFDNVRMMYDGEREPNRFYNCFRLLEKMSLEKLKKSYEVLCDPVKMVYYVDEDVYFLTTDGNHRTLTAMIVGASHIKAEVRIAKCNREKKRKYVAVQKFYEKYSINKIEYVRSGIYNITFKDKEESFTVCGFRQERFDKNCFEVIDILSEQIEYDKKRLKRIGRYPLFLQDIILCLKKNKRLWQYKNRREYSKYKYNTFFLWDL